jgi:hypothetical protein
MKPFAAAAFTVLALGLLLPASPAAAEHPLTQDLQEQADTRWVAWAGCWESADPQEDQETKLVVCFDLLPDRDGVEIRTFMGAEEVAFEEVVADGQPVAIEEGGCTGTRTASWSADGARVFIESDLRCAEGITRATTGVMALADQGNRFLEIHAAHSGRDGPVMGVRHYMPARSATLEAQGIEPPAHQGDRAVRTARSVLAAPLDGDAVVEVVDRAGSDVARVLIAEIGEPFALTAGLLRDLDRKGVPGDVLDVMVAVTYPDRFEITGASWEAAQTREAHLRDGRAYTRPHPISGRQIYLGMDPFYYYDPYFFGMGFSPWGPSWWGYRSPFVRAPIVVVRPEVRDRRARVDPGTGYVPGSTATPTSRSAIRRGTAQPSPNMSPSTRPARTPSATSRPTTTRVTPQGTTTNRRNDDGRRARPRGGSGGGSGGEG